MPDRSPISEPPRGATWAQLRADIDSGLTGDKVAGFDPAAAPLGTDEEAGGARDDPVMIAEIRACERAGRPISAHVNAASPELTPDGRPPRLNYVAPILAGLLGAVVLGLGLWLRL